GQKVVLMHRLNRTPGAWVPGVGFIQLTGRFTFCDGQSSRLPMNQVQEVPTEAEEKPSGAAFGCCSRLYRYSDEHPDLYSDLRSCCFGPCCRRYCLPLDSDLLAAQCRCQQCLPESCWLRVVWGRVGRR